MLKNVSIGFSVVFGLVIILFITLVILEAGDTANHRRSAARDLILGWITTRQANDLGSQPPLRANIFDSVVELTNVSNSPVTIQDITINNRPECTNVDIKAQEQTIENAIKADQELLLNSPNALWHSGLEPEKFANQLRQEISDAKAKLENLQQSLPHQIWISDIDIQAQMVQAQVTGNQEEWNRLSRSLALFGPTQAVKVNLSSPILQVGQVFFRHVSCPNTQIVAMTVQTDHDTWSWDFKN